MNQPFVLLMTAAVVKGATAVAILLAPGLVVRLLFGSELDGIGLSVARIAGMVLFAFALTCLFAARNGELKAITVGMLVYNLLVGAYFVSFGAKAPDIGPLLWPVAVFQVVFAALLSRGLRGLISEDRKCRQSRPEECETFPRTAAPRKTKTGPIWQLPGAGCPPIRS